MQLSGLLVLFSALVFATVVETAQAKYIRKLPNYYDTRYSTDVFEDAELDVPGLITKYRYPVEVHNVTTEDGYILQMHRIPYGRDANNVPNKNKPVVFIMHGILCSSADFIIMGPGAGLGYLLAEEGYDVWMGNARGTHYSRRHVKLHPDGLHSSAYWKFSWDEIGNIDLPTMIDYTLKVSGKDRLHYVGHSQGTTTFFVLGSLRPEYNAKIISMHALAPVAYMAHNENILLKFMAPFANDVEALTSIFGMDEFLPNNEIMVLAGETLCRDQAISQPMCSNILYLIGGWNEDQHNATMMPAIFGHSPAGMSVRQLAHYGQGIASKKFRRYDEGTHLGNYKRYGSSTPPRYDLSKITAPVYLHYSEGDPLAEVPDVYTLHNELGHSMGLFRVAEATFSHVDYLWGIDAKELVYDTVIQLMRSTDKNNV